MLIGQTTEILERSLGVILGAAGGMAVPSVILWHLLRSFIPDERKGFLQTQEKLVSELAEQRKASATESSTQRASFLVALKEVTDHCKQEIELVDRRWQAFVDGKRGMDR